MENMVSMAVSRELSKENTMAYASTSHTVIHAVKSFHNIPKSVSNKRLENKCNKGGRSHDVGKCPAKDKTCLIYQRKDTLQYIAVKKIGNNPITSHLVFW